MNKKENADWSENAKEEKEWFSCCSGDLDPLASDILKERNVELQQYDQINTTFSVAIFFFNMASFLGKVAKELQRSTAWEELSKIHSLWLATLPDAICAELIRLRG